MRSMLLIIATLALAHPLHAQLVEHAILTASDGQLGDQLGVRVALDDGIAVAGAWFEDSACPSDVRCNSGAAYVFEYTEDGVWQEAAKLVVPDLRRQALFGYSVAISGTTAVVGAYNDQESGFLSGAAYVFDRNQGGCGTWGFVAKLTPPDPTEHKQFGFSVGIDGDVIAVGAPGDPYLCPDEPTTCLAGSAYVFEKRDGSWDFLERLTPDQPAPEALFGTNVDLDGDTLVVASPNEDEAGFQVGAVYVFERSGNSFVEREKVLPENQQLNGGLLGWTPGNVTIDNGRILAGAFASDGTCPSSAQQNCGVAYLFEETPQMSWRQEAPWEAPVPSPMGFYGAAAALDESLAAVGQIGDTFSGFVHLREFDAGVWSDRGELRPSDFPGGEQTWAYGSSVALDDGFVAVGAVLADHGCPNDPDCDSGAIYILGPEDRTPPVPESCQVEPEPSCVPDATSICILDDRFKVEVSWTDFVGNTGVGRAVSAGTADSGLFWFFGELNWELLVKMVDGCAFNDRFWFFGAATTNVAYTITVTDTETDARKIYSNRLGVSSPAITDTDAFGGCPGR